MSQVTIIGAGLAGSLLAIFLARRGMKIDVFEAREDMRVSGAAAGRSINLALSDRGIAALRRVGLDAEMLAEAIAMRGRMIHSKGGDTTLLPYSGRAGEYINSISRSGLNLLLIDAADSFDNVSFHFRERCAGFDFGSGEVVFSGGRRVATGTVIATDGAGSAVRHAMMNGGVERFEYSQRWLEHGYKELHIPPAASSREGSSFAIDKNALHIWPRQQFMMIALPNFDGSFTCTLFLAHRDASQASFAALETASDVRTFFDSEFPDAARLMPTLTDDFFNNPTGNLGTVKCFPWSAGGKALLLGDAAHAIVPFYGQGMNCAFEDVCVLDDLIEKHDADWATIYAEFGRLRKPNTDAIADMAVENFYEMRDAVADPVFIRKRQLETRLEQTYTDYFSKYSMVTFREDLPYTVAKDIGNLQDRLLMEACRKNIDPQSVDLETVITKIRQETATASSSQDCSR